MLSSTADKLFWMARYTERAENLARLLDVNHRMSLFPQALQGATQGWSALLATSDLAGEFARHYPRMTPDNAMAFFAFDATNPSSIMSCWRSVRENAHAVRGALTLEVWETINSIWLELQAIQARSLLAEEADAGAFFEWVKYRSHLVLGVINSTMLQDEAFHFTWLGTYLERADNTARILDVKYHLLLPRSEGVGSAVDYYQWGALLNAVAGMEVYRKVYRDTISPRKIAELLVLNADMPRSLMHCLRQVNTSLQDIRNENSAQTEQLAGTLLGELQNGNIDDIFRSRLHEYLARFVERIFELGERVNQAFLIPE